VLERVCKWPSSTLFSTIISCGVLVRHNSLDCSVRLRVSAASQADLGNQTPAGPGLQHRDRFIGLYEWHPRCVLNMQCGRPAGCSRPERKHRRSRAQHRCTKEGTFGWDLWWIIAGDNINQGLVRVPVRLRAKGSVTGFACVIGSNPFYKIAMLRSPSGSRHCSTPVSVVSRALVFIHRRHGACRQKLLRKGCSELPCQHRLAKQELGGSSVADQYRYDNPSIVFQASSLESYCTWDHRDHLQRHLSRRRHKSSEVSLCASAVGVINFVTCSA
jgi:hypothetical protein